MFFKMFQEVFLLCFSIYMLLFQRKKYELSPPPNYRRRPHYPHKPENHK